MRRRLKLYALSAVFLAFSENLSYSNEATEQVRRLELNANPAIMAVPTESKFSLHYYIVPRDWINIESLANLPAELRNLVVEDANHFRWFFHPNDHVAQRRVQADLKTQHLDSRPHALQLQAGQTASRSSFIDTFVTSQPHRDYSIRMSVTQALGAWDGTEERVETGTKVYNKIFESSEAAWTSELARRTSNSPTSGYALLQPDVMAVHYLGPNHAGTSVGSIAYSFRDISQFNRSGHSYIPDFSTYDPNYSEILASINGNTDPVSYWAEQVGQTRGPASADLMFQHRLVMVSAHSQNYLEELDAEMRPTGRVVIRDLGDTIIPEGLHSSLTNADDLTRLKSGPFAKHIGLTDVFTNTISPHEIPIAASWLHGGGENIVNRGVDIFNANFRESFIARLATLSGVSPEEISGIIRSKQSQNGYFYLVIDSESPVWERIAQTMRSHPERVSAGPPIRALDSEVSAALSEIRSQRLESLHERIARNPEAVRKASLIFIAHGGNSADLRPLHSRLEMAWKNIVPSSPSYALTTQQLVLLGTNDPDILLAHAASTSAPEASRIAAISRLKPQQLSATQQRALASTMRWQDSGSRISTQLFSLFEAQRTSDPQVLIRLVTANNNNVNPTLVSIFRNAGQLHPDVIQAIETQILSNERSRFRWGINYELLAQDSRARPFIQQQITSAAPELARSFGENYRAAQMRLRGNCLNVPLLMNLILRR